MVSDAGLGVSTSADAGSGLNDGGPAVIDAGVTEIDAGPPPEPVIPWLLSVYNTTDFETWIQF